MPAIEVVEREAVAVLREYEQWEADLIMCNDVWVNGLPRMTQELYDRFIVIQSKRNSVLARSRSESEAS